MTPTPDGRPAARPRPLLWLYGLIAVSLVTVGVALGCLLFLGLTSVLVPYVARSARCEAMYEAARPLASVDDYNACMAGQARILGSFLVGGALVLLAGALVLAVVVPWRDHRRLRRFGELDQPAAQERFAELSRRHGLSGRRAPRLWVAGPAVHHAFTTAMPGRRPTIVFPTRVALDPGADFDAIVSHEFAHVLARDVTWVSAVRGPLWLFVPVAAVAGLPLFDPGGMSFGPAPTTLIEVALLVVAVAVLAAALLRIREHEADRYAARSGAEAALIELFNRATRPVNRATRSVNRASQPAGRPRRSRVAAQIRRLMARHPDPASRALALRHTDRAFEGGLTQALAVGFVANMAMGTVLTLALTLDWRLYSWGAGAIATAAGAAVLGTLLPSLRRRARQRAARPQWWRSIVGVAIGVVLGAFVSPVVFVPPVGSTMRQVAYPLVQPGSTGHTALAVVVLALTVAGAVALAVSLAALVARTGRPFVARFALVTAGLAAFAGMWPVGPVAAFLNSPNDLRFWWTYGIAGNAWPALAVPLLLAYLLLARQPHRPPDTSQDRRFPWLVAAIAAMIGGAAAILVNPATADLDEQLRAQQQRWWICTIAGVVVLAVVALARPGPCAWARAVVAATATTAVATAAHYLYAQVAGRPAEPDAATSNLAVAPIWLFYATVLLAPVLVPVASRSRTWPSTAWATRFALAGTAGLTAAAAMTVVAVGVPGGTAMDARQLQIAAVAARYATVRHPLTDEQAQRVAQAAVLVLPPTWRGVESGPVGEGIVSRAVTVSNPSCRPLVRESFMSLGQSHLRATGKSTFTSSRTDSDSLRYTDLTITVYSYDSAVGDAVLSAARDARLACQMFSLGDPPVTLDFVVERATPPPHGESSWRYNSSMSATVDSSPFTGTSAYVMIAAGYTIIVVHMSALLEPLDGRLLDLVLSNAVDQLLNLP